MGALKDFSLKGWEKPQGQSSQGKRLSGHLPAGAPACWSWLLTQEHSLGQGIEGGPFVGFSLSLLFFFHVKEQLHINGNVETFP